MGHTPSFYATHFAPDERDAIFLTGYQDEESPGRRLLELTKETGPRSLQLGDKTVEVKCRFDTYGLSAHADRMQMVGLLDKIKPRTVVLVHGNMDAKEAFAATLDCPDIFIADNGDTLTRRYRLRGERAKPLAKVIYARTLDELNFDAARELLGPPGAPIHGRGIAEAWFGSPPPHDLFNAFVSQLEALKLIARDDKRRSMLWVLAPGETDALSDEAELEHLIKTENPKGRLLELCQRLKVALPEFEHEVDGAHFVVQTQIELEGQLHNSGPWRAAAQKTAEQLAARALLKKLSEVDDAPKIIRVLPERKAELTLQNPKGNLLQLLMKRPDLRLDLELKPTPKGFRCRALLEGPKPLKTPWFAAAGKKLVEQAAAEALLALTTQHATFEQAPKAKEQPSPDQDPRVLLNLARQNKTIRDFGYSPAQVSGEAHQPLFTISAWAQISKAERLEGPPAQASGKKEAQRRAAAGLVEQLLLKGIAV